MRRLLPLLTAAGMAILAAAAALAANYAHPMEPSEMIAVGLAVLLVLVLIQSAVARGGETTTFHRRVEDLANLEATLSRTLQHLNARVTRLENHDEARPIIDEATLKTEIEQVRAGVRGLTGAVTDLELRLDRVLLAASDASAKSAPGALVNGTGETGIAEAGEAPASGPALPESIEAAVRDEAVELFLQPVVTLPQRRVRFYDVIACLKTAEGALLWPESYRAHAAASGMMAGIERHSVLRAVQILRRLSPGPNDTALFCRLSLDSLTAVDQSNELLEFMQANKALADSLIFEIQQASLAAATQADWESLATLAGSGFRLSLADTTLVDEDFEQLAARGIRFVRMPGERLLGRRERLATRTTGAELSDSLARFGIDLIANDIKDESTVVELLDCDVRFGQGDLFAPPKPLRVAAAGRVLAMAPGG